MESIKVTKVSEEQSMNFSQYLQSLRKAKEEFQKLDLGCPEIETLEVENHMVKPKGFSVFTLLKKFNQGKQRSD